MSGGRRPLEKVMAKRFTDCRLPPAGWEERSEAGNVPADSELCPAFKDERSGLVYRSRRADGSCASVHLWEGLPEELIGGRDARGRVTRLRQGVTAGFLQGGRFLTREEADRPPHAATEPPAGDEQG